MAHQSPQVLGPDNTCIPKELPLFLGDEENVSQSDINGNQDACLFNHEFPDYADIGFCTLPLFFEPDDFLNFDSSTHKCDALIKNTTNLPTPHLAADASLQACSQRPLEFSSPAIHAHILDEDKKVINLSRMLAQIQGMFFVAEDAFENESAQRPSELTCYRRNLWECVGELTLPRTIHQIQDDQGNRNRISELAVSLTAINSVNGKVTEIVTLPWRRKGGTDEGAMEVAPEFHPLDLSRLQQINRETVNFKFSWKRLRFKHSTPNNGRRNGSQQYYLVQISLVAKIESGQWINVAQIQSNPIVVRGRNPKNFVSKDIPVLSAEGVPQMDAERLSGQNTDKDLALITAKAPQRVTSGKSKIVTDPTIGQRAGVSLERLVMPTAAEKTTRTEMGATEKWQKQEVQSISPLSSDGSATVSPNPSQISGKKDRLYEYFPVSLDDWLPPVETVYLPHMVHLSTVVIGADGKRIPRKLKRYFVAD